MSDATVDAYTERLKTLNAPLLGFILFYTVSEVCIPHDTIVKDLQSLGGKIGSELPSAPKDIDIFQRVCTLAAQNKVPTSDPKVYKNILIRKVTSDREDVIIRRIVVETVKPEGKTLDYDQAADVEFTKATGLITVRNQGSDPLVAQVADQIRSQHAKWRGCLNSYAIREWIRAEIRGLNATIVRPGGGVYFVHAAHEATLATLQEFVKLIPGGSSFHYLPLLDDEKQRGMVKEAFEAESIGEIDNLIAELAELQGKEKVSKRTVTKLRQEYVSKLQKLDEYQDILSHGLGSVDMRMQLFEQGMEIVMKLVKE